MNHIAVTGSRYLTPEQQEVAIAHLKQLLTPDTHLHVGCAPGLDALSRSLTCNYTLYETQGFKPWQLQQRSKRMIGAIAGLNGILHGWPNKPCPDGLTITSWKGSGTWGTMRYAISQGVTVIIHPLTALELPEWYDPPKQLVIW